jgi:uncharacterized protein HemX
MTEPEKKLTEEIAELKAFVQKEVNATAIELQDLREKVKRLTEENRLSGEMVKGDRELNEKAREYLMDAIKSLSEDIQTDREHNKENFDRLGASVR